jgi:hypothetical protein
MLGRAGGRFRAGYAADGGLAGEEDLAAAYRTYRAYGTREGDTSSSMATRGVSQIDRGRRR